MYWKRHQNRKKQQCTRQTDIPRDAAMDDWIGGSYGGAEVTQPCHEN